MQCAMQNSDVPVSTSRYVFTEGTLHLSSVVHVLQFTCTCSAFDAGGGRISLSVSDTRTKHA